MKEPTVTDKAAVSVVLWRSFKPSPPGLSHILLWRSRTLLCKIFSTIGLVNHMQ
jgi:hypothetical protein